MSPLPGPSCGACGSMEMEFVARLPLYVRNGHIPTKVWKCRECGTFMRDNDYSDLQFQSHFEVASYTDPDAEDRLYTNRMGFFRYLIGLTEHHLDRPLRGTRALDIGCAYGHLLRLLASEGVSGAGVEIVDRLRERLTRDFTVFANLEDVSKTELFDAVFMIDSLYCFETPARLLQETRIRLDPSGLLIIRVTNRTPVLNLMRVLGRPITNAHVGDAKHNFSFAGMRRLLYRTGFDVERAYLWERGKRGQPLTVRLYYEISALLSAVLRVKLTPGMILVCRPTDATIGRVS